MSNIYIFSYILLHYFSLPSYQFKNDEEFANNIQSNTTRYVSHFEEVADKLLPPCTSNTRHNDIYDFLQAQRLEQLQRASTDPTTMPTTADTPQSLVRRYEVCIIPFSASKPRKLREVKSAGMLTIYFDVIIMITDLRY